MGFGIIKDHFGCALARNSIASHVYQSIRRLIDQFHNEYKRVLVIIVITSMDGKQILFKIKVVLPSYAKEVVVEEMIPELHLIRPSRNSTRSIRPTSEHDRFYFYMYRTSKF